MGPAPRGFSWNYTRIGLLRMGMLFAIGIILFSFQYGFTKILLQVAKNEKLLNLDMLIWISLSGYLVVSVAYTVWFLSAMYI
jgi:hypothetical protein